eukprot:4714109-Amphidinium_carterae.2
MWPEQKVGLGAMSQGNAPVALVDEDIASGAQHPETIKATGRFGNSRPHQVVIQTYIRDPELASARAQLDVRTHCTHHMLFLRIGAEHLQTA